MKTYLGLALVFVAMGFSSIGQVFATGSFDITTNCYDLTYPVNCGSTYVTVTVTSVNGFSGTVDLSAQVGTGNCTNCSLTPTLNPTSIFIPSGGSNTSHLSFTHTCHTDLYHPNCNWDVTVQGTSGSLSNSTDVFVCYGKNCPL